GGRCSPRQGRRGDSRSLPRRIRTIQDHQDLLPVTASRGDYYGGNRTMVLMVLVCGVCPGHGVLPASSPGPLPVSILRPSQRIEPPTLTLSNPRLVSSAPTRFGVHSCSPASLHQSSYAARSAFAEAQELGSSVQMSA